MPINDTNIAFKYSVKTGSAGNTVAGNAAGSLGKYISTTELTSAVLYNLFPTLTGDQNFNELSDYKCLFIHNKHATLTLVTPILWLTSKTASSTTYTIGLDTNLASAIGAASAQAALVATTANAPAGVTFSEPLTKGAGLAVGDLLPGYARAFWVKREANNTGPVNADNITLALDGDTRF